MGKVLERQGLLQHALGMTMDFQHLTVLNARATADGCELLVQHVDLPPWAVQASLRWRNPFASGPVSFTLKLRQAPAEDGELDWAPRNTMLEYAAIASMPPHPHVVPMFARFQCTLPPHLAHLAPALGNMPPAACNGRVQGVLLEYAPSSLDEELRRDAPLRQLTMSQKLQWCLDVASAAAHAWQYGVLHMGLTPSNVLIERDGRAVLSGFHDCLSVHRFQSADLVVNRGMPGELARVAPEVLTEWAAAQAAQREAADDSASVSLNVRGQGVWALGVLMHEILLGEHPFPGYPMCGTGVVPACGSSAVRKAAEGVADLPAGVGFLLQRMLSGDPAQRPPTLAAAYEKLVLAAVTPSLPPDWRTAPTPDVVERVWRMTQSPLLSAADRAGSASDWDTALGKWAQGADALGQLARCWLAMAAHADSEPDGVQRATELMRQALNWVRSVALAQPDGDDKWVHWLHSLPEPERASWQRAAQLFMGWTLQYGLGTQEDGEEAKEWYSRAAKAGCVHAKYHLGAYLHHTLPPGSGAEWLAWMHDAGYQGHPRAQALLGVAFEYGDGLGFVDSKMASEWYHRAAARGHPGALKRLGRG